jgi:hypothetical protein
MPVDPMLSDSMLSTFRNLAAECRAKQMTGPAIEAMNAELARMERYAAEMSDFPAFSARLMQEGCFNNFSQHYSKALADEARAKAQAGGGGGDGGDPDAGLLAQTLSAYQGALDRYQAELAAGRMKARDATELGRAVQAILDLGRSGISYPVFLRTLVEKGLDRALEGSVLVRDGLLFDLEWAEFGNLPPEIELRRALVAAFDELAAAAPFGVPDALAFELRRQRVEWEHAPALARWKAVTRRWENLVGIVHDWLDAYTSFAPRDDRWVDAGNPANTQKNIRRTRQVAPFRLREFERIFAETCGMTWADIFHHPTYTTAWYNVDIAVTAAKLEQIMAAHDRCVPGGQPTPELVRAAEQLHQGRGDLRHADLEAKAERMRRRYDQFHGDGAYARDFPA